MLRMKQNELQAEAGQVFIKDALLKNVFDFKYLGFTFAADGDFRHAVAIRLEKAKAPFGMLWMIWGSDLPRSAQINLYSAAVDSILTHGYEAWPMTEKLMTSIKQIDR